MKRFKETKSWTIRHPPSTTHLPNKTRVFGDKNDILIKYKRIKWTPSKKAALLSAQGKTIFRSSKINFFLVVIQKIHNFS